METDYFELPPRQPIEDCHVMFVSRWQSAGAFPGDIFGFVDSRCNVTSNSTAVVASRSSAGYKAWFSRHASPRVGFVFFFFSFENKVFIFFSKKQIHAKDRFNFSTNACFVRSDGMRLADSAAGQFLILFLF